MKFLIDECLTPRLRQIAVASGHHESTCVRDRGWQGTKDRDLMEKVLSEEFTLVTNNSVDFRGGGPGSLSGHHAKAEIHCGLVCLNAQSGMCLDTQRAMFAAALDLLDRLNVDLINRALELFLLENGTLEYSVYDIPAPGKTGVAVLHSGNVEFDPYLDQVASGTL